MLNGKVIWQASDSPLSKELHGSGYATNCDGRLYCKKYEKTSDVSFSKLAKRPKVDNLFNLVHHPLGQVEDGILVRLHRSERTNSDLSKFKVFERFFFVRITSWLIFILDRPYSGKWHIFCHLVVSMTNVSGGLMMSFPTETGQDMQLQATQRPLSPGQSASEVHVQPSLRQGSAGRSLEVHWGIIAMSKSIEIKQKLAQSS